VFLPTACPLNIIHITVIAKVIATVIGIVECQGGVTGEVDTVLDPPTTLVSTIRSLQERRRIIPTSMEGILQTSRATVVNA
jgi:hypothetical protein